MDIATLYEYKISKGKFIQIAHEAEVKKGKEGSVFYTVRISHPKRRISFRTSDLDIVFNSHFFLFPII